MSDADRIAKLESDCAQLQERCRTVEGKVVQLEKQVDALRTQERGDGRESLRK